MAVMVGWVPDSDDEDLLAADLPCPDPEDLLDPTDPLPAALLLGADPRELPGPQVDAGLSAWFAHTNQTALAQARWILETSRAQPDTRERITDRHRPGKIIAATLGWSEGYATGRLEFAHHILERLPALGQAMAAGVLEEHKAWIFTSTLADLDTTQARTVVDQVLPAAPRLAFHTLRLRIEKAAHAVDPDWAAARRAAAVARRRVTFRVAPSGAAELCGLDLPEDPAQDAHDRIVALARHIARRLRHAGLDAPTGPIQSEVMLTLTGPAGVGMWDTDVIDHVVSRFGGPTTTDLDNDPDDGDGSGPNDTDDDGPDEHGPGDGGGLDDDGGGPEDSGAGDDPDDEADTESPDAAQQNKAVAEGDLDSSTDRDATRATTTSIKEPEDEKAPWRVPFVPRVALRVGLATVLGLDTRPGELPGRGPVTNTVAVAMAWARTHSTVRLLLYTPDGHLDDVLTLRPPRTGPPPPHSEQRRHHIVELTAYTSELDTWATALPAEHPTVDDPEPPPALRLPPGGTLVPGDALGLLDRAVRALAAARARPPSEHPAHTDAEAAHRHPSAALRAWVQARDRTCRSPGCAADAATCDLDHTLAITDGGLTRADDLGPLCRRDHTHKHHPDSGWTVQQTRPGRFEWTAPTGRTHIKEPEPYDPLPDPVPRTDHSELPGHTLHPPHPPPPITHAPGSPRRNKHGYLTDAALTTAAHLRERARARTHEPVSDTEADQNADDRFPEEPPF